MDIKYRALRAVSGGKHLRCVSMMVDAANQDKWDVPHLFPETHGSDRWDRWYFSGIDHKLLPTGHVNGIDTTRDALITRVQELME